METEQTGKTYVNCLGTAFFLGTRWLREGRNLLRLLNTRETIISHRTWLQCRGLIQDYTVSTVKI